MKWISYLWVTLSALALCLRWLSYDFDFGPFTKVPWFDLAKAVEGRTAGWHGQALLVPVVARPSGAWLCGLFDLEILATRNLFIN
jgi:hypothetical protein